MAADDDPAWPRRLARGDLQGSLPGRVDAWLAAHGDKVPADLALSLRGRMGGTPLIDRPLQLVHNDYRSANVICEGGRVGALLDFEEAGMDHAVVDLARAAVRLGTSLSSTTRARREVAGCCEWPSELVDGNAMASLSVSSSALDDRSS